MGQNCTGTSELKNSSEQNADQDSYINYNFSEYKCPAVGRRPQKSKKIRYFREVYASEESRAALCEQREKWACGTSERMESEKKKITCLAWRIVDFFFFYLLLLFVFIEKASSHKTSERATRIRHKRRAWWMNCRESERLSLWIKRTQTRVGADRVSNSPIQTHTNTWRKTTRQTQTHTSICIYICIYTCTIQLIGVFLIKKQILSLAGCSCSLVRARCVYLCHMRLIRGAYTQNTNAHTAHILPNLGYRSHAMRLLCSSFLQMHRAAPHHQPHMYV